MSTGFVVWFTGLSGAGKSTLTTRLAAALRQRGVHVEPLDGDEVRKNLSRGLGFSREDRDMNIRRIGYVARLIARSGGCAIAAAISPYRNVRDELRRSTDHFVEVYCECPLEVLKDRDPKGLYAKALAGEIKNFTGVDDPYEPPVDPEVHVRTDLENPDESTLKILQKLEELGYLRPAGKRGPSQVRPHGGELVDRYRTGSGAELARERAAGLPAVQLDAVGEAWLRAIAGGLLSPLTGFMTSKDYKRVMQELRLENGLAWSLPVTLPCPLELQSQLQPGSEAALIGCDGERLAILEVADQWRVDVQAETQALYGNQSAPGPFARENELRLGGPVQMFAAADPRDVEAGPRQLRKRLSEGRWEQRAAVWLPTPATRADAYLLRTVLEGRDGVVVLSATVDGLGHARSDRQAALSQLGESFAAGRLVTCVPSVALPATLTPERLELMRAVIAKNLGCTAVLQVLDAVARAKLDKNWAGFEEGELGIEVVRRAPPAYSPKVGSFGTAHTLPDGDLVSGEDLREELTQK